MTTATSLLADFFARNFPAAFVVVTSNTDVMETAIDDLAGALDALTGARAKTENAGDRLPEVFAVSRAVGRLAKLGVPETSIARIAAGERPMLVSTT